MVESRRNRNSTEAKVSLWIDGRVAGILVAMTLNYFFFS